MQVIAFFKNQVLFMLLLDFITNFIYICSQNPVSFFKYKYVQYSKYTHAMNVYANWEYVISYGCYLYFKYIHSFKLSTPHKTPGQELNMFEIQTITLPNHIFSICIYICHMCGFGISNRYKAMHWYKSNFRFWILWIFWI
jgi:hypothetical protein